MFRSESSRINMKKKKRKGKKEGRKENIVCSTKGISPNAVKAIPPGSDWLNPPISFVYTYLCSIPRVFSLLIGHVQLLPAFRHPARHVFPTAVLAVTLTSPIPGSITPWMVSPFKLKLSPWLASPFAPCPLTPLVAFCFFEKYPSTSP